MGCLDHGGGHQHHAGVRCGDPLRRGVGIIFLILSTALAHRYWEYTGPAVAIQQGNFFKNISMLGGMLYVFVFGPGRFSVDAMMRKS